VGGERLVVIPDAVDGDAVLGLADDELDRPVGPALEVRV
jgi:hypothetical protein